MQIFHAPLELQQEIIKRKRKGQRIGFVPTMGALHDGHCSLFDIARKECDWLVCSIFVNPLQFAANEDLDQYPSDFQGDSDKCQKHNVDALLYPTRQFYEADHSTYVRVDQLSQGLCGGDRPTHFEGVTTVVARLFGIVQPDVAVFGQKDYQQLAIIRRLVRDLAMPINIIGAPLIREKSGLALSSRNKYLSNDQKTRALTLSKTLFSLQTILTKKPNIAISQLKNEALKNLDADQLDYLEIVDCDSLRPLKKLNGKARALIAAKIGNTRLIDNIEISNEL